MRVLGYAIGAVMLVAGCAQDAPTPTPAATAPAATVRAATASPTPTGQHWLVGRWRGQIPGMQSDSGRRTLVVTNVTADGTVTGRYQGQQVPMSLSGETLRFTSAGSGTHELRRSGPNELQGALMSGRNVRSYTLTRE